MPRSSRHKSSKHGSRDTRDYSDSEKDFGLKEKEKKSKEESSGRISKESGSGEKRKLDSRESSKDLSSFGNGEYAEEYSSSKRRKDKADDGVSDRWNGGEDDGKGEKKSKAYSESKSKRREEVEGDDTKRSKSEGKHRESTRKEEREREKKGKEGKSDRLIQSEERLTVKQFAEKTDLDVSDRLRSPESESLLERRLRKRRDSSGDGDKHLEDSKDVLDQVSFRNDTGKDGRAKDEKHKDERYRDKYREDKDREGKHQDDKLRDDRSARDHANSKSSEKHVRDEKDVVEVRQKKSKAQDSDLEHDHEHDRECERERDRYRDREWERYHDRDRYREHDRNRDHDRQKKSKAQDSDLEHDHEHDRECERERDRYRDREWERYHDRDRYREHDRNRDRDNDRDHDYDCDWDQDRDNDRERDRRDRDRERDRDRDRGRDFDHDRDGLHVDEQSTRYKDSKGKKKSPDDRDDGNDTKSRSTEAQYADMENKSLTSGRVELDAEGGRSQSRQANVDAAMGSNRRRTSPGSSSHGGTDEYRHLKPEDSKYRDSMSGKRSKAASSREDTAFSGASEKGAKYRSMEKSRRVDDGLSGELPIERSSSSKASPMSMMERSPSSTSLERRHMNRSGVRRSLDIEETGRRSSGRELSAVEDRLSRDLPPEKLLLDESSQADSVFYNRAGQGNSSLIPPPHGFRAGIGSPSFLGSLEEDNRINTSGRYKRSGDPNVGRGQANAWRGAPSWPSPVPNGFLPFQPGPPHGGFQGMMPQFPSSSMFGVRPSMEINHSGIPYHIADVERFSNHLRPMGWQNMMDGSGPAHLHGWDGNHVVFRDDAPMFGGPEWDQNRPPLNGRGWDTISDVWKGQSGDVDLPSTSQKEDHPMQASLDDVNDSQECQRSEYENGNGGVQVKGLEIRSEVTSPVKESSRFSPQILHKEPYSSKMSSDDGHAHYCRRYLSRLDISTELAGSELYDQCMGLLNMEQNKDLIKDITKLVNLKNGGRAVHKASIAVLSPSLIPATNASVFQKAMDLYKKGRLQTGAIPNVNGGILAFISASNEKGKEQSSDHGVEEAEEPVLVSDAEMLDSDQLKGEAVPTAATQENTEQLVSIQSRELTNQMDTLSQEKSNHKSLEVCKPVLNGNKAGEIESERTNSGDVVVDSLRPLDNASEAVVLPTDGENSNDINKTEGDNSVYCAKERQALGGAISGSLFFSDGPLGLSRALIPGSNESESVILSRIHDSPENTH